MTPLQTELSREHKERLGRFSAAAASYRAQQLPPPIPPTPKPPPPPLPPEPMPPQPEASPPIRAPWFYIIGDASYPKITAIQHVVARQYNISLVDLLSHRRTAAIVGPRQIAMYLAKRLTLKSLPEIGRRFNGRDHTTVLHAVRKIEGLLEHDADVSHEINVLETLLKPAALPGEQVEVVS